MTTTSNDSLARLAASDGAAGDGFGLALAEAELVDIADEVGAVHERRRANEGALTAQARGHDARLRHEAKVAVVCHGGAHELDVVVAHVAEASADGDDDLPPSADDDLPPSADD